MHFFSSQKDVFVGILALSFINTAVAAKLEPLQSPHINSGTSATIKLFPAVPYDSSHTDGCSDDFPANIITLDLEVCLSGAYYLKNNLQIKKKPSCPDGQVPAMVFFPNRGCTGTPSFRTNRKGAPIPSQCIWSSIHPPYYWSMLFTCSIWANLSPPQPSTHKVALPPPSDSVPTGPVDGSLVPYHWPDCKNPGPYSTPTPGLLPVDTCLQTPGYGVRIFRHAICPNGTRAQWARFIGPDCNDRIFVEKDGLIDIQDNEINQCQSLGDVSRPDEKFGSMAFYCDGLGSNFYPLEFSKVKKEVGWSAITVILMFSSGLGLILSVFWALRKMKMASTSQKLKDW